MPPPPVLSCSINRVEDNTSNRLQLRRGVKVRVSGLDWFRLLGRGVEGTWSVRSIQSFAGGGFVLGFRVYICGRIRRICGGP